MGPEAKNDCKRKPVAIWPKQKLKWVVVAWLPELWDRRIWSWVPQNAEPRMTMLARAISSILKEINIYGITHVHLCTCSYRMSNEQIISWCFSSVFKMQMTLLSFLTLCGHSRAVTQWLIQVLADNRIVFYTFRFLLLLSALFQICKRNPYILLQHLPSHVTFSSALGPQRMTVKVSRIGALKI
jgi:hypothetical protein